MNEAPAASDVQRLSPRKQAIRDLNDRLAPERARWRAKNKYFHAENIRYMRFLVPPGLSVLELGCGAGDLLAALEPARGVGVDLSPGMVEAARQSFPRLDFRVGDIEDPATLAALEGPFDVILLSETVGDLEDVEATFAGLHALCRPDTRLIVSYHSPLWKPVLRLAIAIGQKMPARPDNWLALEDIENLLMLADFELIRHERRQLLPKRLLGLGSLVNRYVGTLPGIRLACLYNYVVVRPLRGVAAENPSVSVVIPARNEHGNIAAAIERLPAFCDDIEIVFVEGHSSDGTLEEMHRVKAAHGERDIKVVVQDGIGKGDAVRKGFEVARGDVLMILDADLTMPPEQLLKFYDALTANKGEFILGSRLVYPMQSEAMRLLNLLANHGFSLLFTWLLNQRFTDTLCGTKVLSASHYRQIAANRSYFGDFDPFGDFDLIFGAAKLNLKIVEVPIRYANRAYGETQISRFRHGWLLLRMVVFAYRKLKAI